MKRALLIVLVALAGIAILASVAAAADAAAPAPTAAPAPAAAPTTAPAKPPWYQNISINGYIQARFEARQYDSMPAASDKPAEHDEFTIRRYYMNVIAPFNKETTLVATYAGAGSDFRDGANADWENLFIDYTPMPELSVRLGQGPNFFGLDASESSSVRIPCERALVAEGNSALGIKGIYALGPSDRGLWVTYDTRPLNPSKEGLRAVAGVCNGQFQETDKNDNKNISLDAEYFTWWGQFGASWMQGKYTSTATTTVASTTTNRNARGLNLRLFPGKLVPNIGFQAEWMEGDWFGAKRRGWYGQASYHFTGHPGIAFVRDEQFDLNRDAANNKYDAIHLGYTYNLTPQDALTAEGVFGTLGRGASKSGDDATDDLIVQWQRKF
jgi:hypothetical protein